MPLKRHELYSKIDALAKEAEEVHGDERLAYILRQVAEIGRQHKATGIRRLYDSMVLHCATMVSDMAIIFRNER